MKNLYDTARNIVEKSAKGLAGVLVGGMIVAGGNAYAGDKRVFSKSLGEMSPQEQSNWNFQKSMMDYHNTPKDQRNESSSDYIIRGGSQVNPDGPATKDASEPVYQQQRGETQRGGDGVEIKVKEFFAYARGKGYGNKNQKIFNEGDEVLFDVKYDVDYNVSRFINTENVFKVINLKDKKIIHQESRISKTAVSHTFLTDIKKPFDKGDYLIIFEEKGLDPITLYFKVK